MGGGVSGWRGGVVVGAGWLLRIEVWLFAGCRWGVDGCGFGSVGGCDVLVWGGFGFAVALEFL